MPYTLIATCAAIESDESTLTIGFADDDRAPKQYVLIQQPLNPTMQDRKLGLDKVYIEVNDQSRASYGGIRGISVVGKKVTISLAEPAAKRLRIESGEIEIDGKLARNFDNCVEGLKRIAESHGIAFTS